MNTTIKYKVLIAFEVNDNLILPDSIVYITTPFHEEWVGKVVKVFNDTGIFLGKIMYSSINERLIEEIH